MAFRSPAVAVAVLFSVLFGGVACADDCAPETWFHLIGGNVSKEGLTADLEAIAAAGIGGIQLFHGAGGQLWPGVDEPIPCLSEKWTDLVKFAESECRRLGLSFKMQNCPGWSMSGGPWITPDKAMRRLVSFEPDKRPNFDRDDDFHEIATVTFPCETGSDGRIRTVSIPAPTQLDHGRCYEPGGVAIFDVGEQHVFRRPIPRGVWQDDQRVSYALEEPIAIDGRPAKLTIGTPYWGSTRFTAELSTERKLDNWEGKTGRVLREFTMSTNATPVVFKDTKTLVFGHVNAKERNGPAPAEATGWECDKLDPRGFEANFAGYLGKLIQAGVKIDGTLVDSWECRYQNWTWRMEEYFEARNGYALRPWLPALFGYILRSEAETERFLLDWRETCSRLVEENYFGTIARLAHEHGMKVQYETAFGDVLSGDPMRFWKYADEPMCEFWSPHNNAGGFVYSHDFKAVRPCVSAAHIYGKSRVSAESFTSFDLTFDEHMQTLKEDANRHFARGVTHLVFHTYTHNPVVGGLPPGSSFGQHIGTPFLRLQTWWPYMPEFTKYLGDCCRELEKGKPVVDILWYLGDSLTHRPSEPDDLFGNSYKYDYLNHDVLMDGIERLSFRVLWIPTGTWLSGETERRLAELAAQGVRIVRGDLKPDWEAQLSGGDVFWYERRDGDDVCYFIAAKEHGFKGTLKLRDLGGEVTLDLARGESRFVRKGDLAAQPPVRRELVRLTDWSRPLGPWKDLPGTAADKAFSGTRRYVTRIARPQGRVELDLGRVANWARVTVNGKEVARLWCEPYRCELTEALREGDNELVVEVTSTWFNRLVYDARQPEALRQTWTIAGPSGDAQLRDSGLIGPVLLMSVTACGD